MWWWILSIGIIACAYITKVLFRHNKVAKCFGVVTGLLAMAGLFIGAGLGTKVVESVEETKVSFEEATELVKQGLISYKDYNLCRNGACEIYEYHSTKNTWFLSISGYKAM